jgi:hypothetical protein
MNSLEMFPDESTNARVIRDRLIRSIRMLVSSRRAFNRDVVGEGLSPMRNLWTKNVGDVALKNSRRVCPTHRQNCESKRAKRSIESRQISRVRMELSLIEGDVEIQGRINRSTSEVLSDDIGVRRHSSVLNCHCIQRLEGMDEAKGLSILLEDTEPSTVVGRRRRLIDTRFPLILDDLDNLVEDTSRDRTLSKYPGDVRDMRDFDGSEILWIEGTSLIVCPSKSSVVLTEDPLDELDLFRKK